MGWASLRFINREEHVKIICNSRRIIVICQSKDLRLRQTKKLRCIFFIKPSNVSAFIEIILLFYNLYTYVSIFAAGYKWKYMHNVMQNLI